MSVANFIEKEHLATFKPHNEPRVFDPEVSIVNMNGKKFATFGPQLHQKFPGHETVIKLNPTSFSAGQITSTSPIEFRISPNICSHIESLYLDFTFTNSDNSNTVTPTLLPFCVDRIEFYVNGTLGAPIQVLSSIGGLYDQLQFYDQTELTNILSFNKMNMTSTAFANPSAIGTLTTVTYTLPLLFSCFKHYNPQTYNSDLIMYVYMRTNPVDAGTGTLVFSALQLRLITALSAARSAAFKELASSYPILRPYINPVVQNFTGTINASTQLEIPLNFNGKAAAISFVIRSNPTTVAGGAIFNFAAVGGIGIPENTSGSIDLLNADQVSLLASGALKPANCRSFEGNSLSGIFSTATPYYWIVLCDDFMETMQSGADSGGVVLNNTQYLRIVPSVSWVNGTYTVSIVAWMYGETLQKDGTFYKVM